MNFIAASLPQPRLRRWQLEVKLRIRLMLAVRILSGRVVLRQDAPLSLVHIMNTEDGMQSRHWTKKLKHQFAEIRALNIEFTATTSEALGRSPSHPGFLRSLAARPASFVDAPISAGEAAHAKPCPTQGPFLRFFCSEKV